MELNDNVRQDLINAITDAIGELSGLTPGSDEYSKQAEVVNKLYKLYLDEYAKATEAYKVDLANKVDSKRLENDWFIREREVALKENEQRAASKWYNKFKWDTLITCGTVVFGTGACIAVQVSEHAFPDQLMKFIMKIGLKA